MGTTFALYSAFERAHDLSGLWAFVFSGVSFAVCFGFAFLSPSNCLGACFPALEFTPRPEIESTFLALLPFPRAIEPRPYAHEPPRARCVPFLGSGLPLIPVSGFVLEVFNSGFESRPPRELKFTAEFEAGPRITLTRAFGPCIFLPPWGSLTPAPQECRKAWWCTGV